MPILNLCRTSIAMLLVATQSSALLLAQQRQANQRLSTRTVCLMNPDSVIGFAEGGCASLTRDGQWLITKEESGELVRYRTSDLSRQEIVSPARVQFSWIDSQTDAVFVFTVPGPKIKTNQPNADLHCFENVERVMRWQPTWSRQNVPIAGGGIHWVPGKMLYARICFTIRRREETDISWLDQTGNDIGSCKIPGMLVGIDTSEENEIEAYFLTRDGKMKVAVFSTVTRQGSVGEVSDLFYSRSATRFPHLPGRWTYGTRMFRLGALGPGDVRRLVVDRMSRPQFFAYQDLAYSINDPLYLRCLGTSFGRLHNLGMLSAAEVETDFEIIDPQIACLGGSEYYPPCIVNRAHQIHQFPKGHQIIDATKHRDNWTFLTTSREQDKILLKVSNLVPAG